MITNFGIWRREMDHWNIHHRVMKVYLSYAIVLILIFGIAGQSEAIAKEYFVAADNGNDGYKGTQEAPYLTLEKGVSVLLPGDTLYVRGGTYQRSKYLWEPPNGLSWEKPVAIMSYQKEKVIVIPMPGKTVFEFKNNSQYIIMDGFIVDGTNGHDGIRMGKDSHHIRIAHSEIKNAPHQGIQVSNGTFHELLELSIHHNGITSNTPGQSHGIYMPGNNNLIESCDVFENGAWGIHIYGLNNYTSNNIVRNNRVYNNNRANGGGPGIGVHHGTNNLVYNNLVWGNKDGIIVDYGPSNSKIYNNTVYMNDRYELWLGGSSRDSIVKNNILFKTNDNAALMIVKGSGVSTIENNLIIAPTPIANSETNVIFNGNLVGNNFKHGFVNPNKHDFHLTEDSSAISKGIVISEVETDFDGIVRSLPFDIGAYSFGSSLARPTNLSIISIK